MKHIFLSSVLAVILFSSCHFFGRGIKGDGNVISQVRAISDFSSIDVSSAIDVYITQDAAFSVKVETDNNLQEYIEVYKEGGVLHIRQRSNTNLDPSRDTKVYVSAPMYQRLEASGACSIIGSNMISSTGTVDIDLTGASNASLDIKAPKVSAGLNGASKITLKGETKDLLIDGHGASHVNCFDLSSENAAVDVSGASSAEVFASVKLDAEASGASHVRYKGNPVVSKNESGAGSVEKAD
jgi:hypothetical protein